MLEVCLFRRPGCAPGMARILTGVAMEPAAGQVTSEPSGEQPGPQTVADLFAPPARPDTKDAAWETVAAADVRGETGEFATVDRAPADDESDRCGFATVYPPAGAKTPA